MTLKEKDPFYKEGYILSLQNAKGLKDISCKAAELGNYGLACSLNILAAEEVVKGYFLIVQYHNPNGTIINFNKIFSSHPVKHKELGYIIKTDEKIYNQTKEFLFLVEPALNHFAQMPEAYKIRNKELLESLKDDYNWMKKMTEIKLNFGKILPWLENANKEKNAGLYVDKQNNAWVSPNDILESKFIEEQAYTDALINYVPKIDEMFMRVESAKNFRSVV